jgi:hypothetical protein
MSLKKAREILGENLADSTQTVIVPNHHASLKIQQDFKGTVLTNLEILVGSFAGIYISLYFFPALRKKLPVF